MGNYISIIIGCVGAVEIITFLHQISLRADEEHDRELEEEATAACLTSAATTSSDDKLEPQTIEQTEIAITFTPALALQPPSMPVIKEASPGLPVEVDGPMLEKKESHEARQGFGPRSHTNPEIRFELYERSCSLSDVDRPLVDGLKLSRPLVRDDGSGRRKSIKKRNSSGSINWKASREEELRMFTSLEEEEFSSLSEGGYIPISYGSSNADSSSPGGVLHPRRHRRFKRSPIKDSQLCKEDSSSSHEVLEDVPVILEDPMDTVVSYPWGDIKPMKHRRHSRHEKSMSIEELQEDEEKLAANDEVVAAVAIENVGVGGVDSGQLQKPAAPSSATDEHREEKEMMVVDEDENEEDSVSRGGVGESRIIVSIESQPNIERFARLSLHDLDEDRDADDDMTPMASENERSSHTAFDYQRLEKSSSEENGPGKEDVDEMGEEEEEEDEDTLRAEDNLETEAPGEMVEAVVYSSTDQKEVIEEGEEARSECDASDTRTLSPDVEEVCSVVDIKELQMKGTPKVRDFTTDFLESERHQEFTGNIPTIDEIIIDCPIAVKAPQDCVIDFPSVAGQSVDGKGVENQYPVETCEKHEENIEIIESPEIEVYCPTTPEIPSIQITPVMEMDSDQLIQMDERERIEEVSSESFIDHEKSSPHSASASPSPIIITTEESPSNTSVVDEDISNYDNFISIIHSNVMKEVTTGFRFPLSPENKPGDFPKTMSELITFDDEDMTDAECKNLQMRKRQDSIKVKIQTENTTLRKKTGHHRRYNMPAHSIDMSTRIVLSNRTMEDHQKVFPRNRQIFIPGNFPRNILDQSEYKLKDGNVEGPPPGPVRVKRISYTQPVVQLTMIREELQKTLSTVPPSPPPSPGPPTLQLTSSLPFSLPPVSTSQSVPATPQGLAPQHPIEPFRRSRSVTPFIVDRDDPMMVLLKDSMEIPLVYNTKQE